MVKKPLKHTKAPWRAELTNYNDGMPERWNVLGKTNADLIASVGKNKDDAVLIAAAPEMKEAIEYYLNGVNHFFKCINWRNSNLDAEAIDFMNQHNLKFEAINKKLNY